MNLNEILMKFIKVFYLFDKFYLVKASFLMFF